MPNNSNEFQESIWLKHSHREIVYLMGIFLCMSNFLKAKKNQYSLNWTTSPSFKVICGFKKKACKKQGYAPIKLKGFLMYQMICSFNTTPMVWNWNLRFLTAVQTEQQFHPGMGEGERSIPWDTPWRQITGYCAQFHCTSYCFFSLLWPRVDYKDLPCRVSLRFCFQHLTARCLWALMSRGYASNL